MNAQILKALLGSFTVAATCAIATVPAQASTLINGWSYASDPINDGSDFSGFGVNSRFNIYGIGIKQVGNEVWVGLNTNLPVGGVADNSALGKSIGWGDLLFNFTGGTLKTANDSSSLLGVRFAGTNDSAAPSTGVYTGVQGKSVATANRGYNDLQQYANTAKNWTGAYPVIGDLAWNSPYFAGYGAPPSVISTFSQKVGGVTLLSNVDLNGQGFNATGAGLPGNNAAFGFKFATPDGFVGDYTATLFLECINDSIAIQGTARPVPVPGALAGIAVAGAYGSWQIARKKKQQKATLA